MGPYFSFPRAHWRRPRTTNSVERLHGEIKRRTRSVGAFPDRASALRLITAVAIEVTAIWGDRQYHEGTRVNLGVVSTGRDNNLTLVRFLAASTVVYSHAYGILGRTSEEPFHSIFGIGAGDFGVNVFFFVSGFLICKSWLSRSNLVDFCWARMLRILPALWVSNLFFALIFGAAFTTLSLQEYYKHPLTQSYLWRNSTMLPGWGAQTRLPVELGAHGIEFNVPLWTLPHELQMYGLLAILGLVGLANRPWTTGVLALGAFAAFELHNLQGIDLVDPDRARFVYFFFAGSTIYNLRTHIGVSHWSLGVAMAVIAATCLVTGLQDFRQLALAVATPAIVLWSAYVPTGPIRRFNSIGDYSYGIYIFACPLQLLAFHWFGPQHPLLQFLLAMLMVLPMAILSWHYLESHALRMFQPSWVRRLHSWAARWPNRLW